MPTISVTYTGLVQGVGFRYTVRSLAHDLSIDGTVRNNADGTVTLVARGENDQIDRLRERIRESGVGRIDREDAHESADPVPDGAFEILR